MCCVEVAVVSARDGGGCIVVMRWIVVGLWDVRYTAIHSWVGTIGIPVEGGWSGGWSDGRRSGGMSPLIG